MTAPMGFAPPAMPAADQTLPPGQRATTLGEQSPTTITVDANPLAPEPPPLEKVRGAEYPASGAASGVKLEYLKRLLSATDAEHLARCKQQAFHMLMANGKHHIAWSNRSRRWEETPLIENETRVTLNFIRPILRARTNRLLPKNFDWQVVPDSNDYDARDQAKVAERFLGAMRQRTHLVRLTDLALELGYSGGVSFLKSFWNPTIGAPRPAQLVFTEMVPQPLTDNEGQPLLDENDQPLTQMVPQNVQKYVNRDGQPVESAQEAYWFRPGDTDLAVRTLFTVRWNEDAEGFSSAEGLRWVIDQQAVPVAVAKERYPEFADKISASADSGVALTYQRMAALAAQRAPDRALQSSSGATAKPTEYTTITEYYELDSLYFKSGRLIVFVGEVEVGDGDLPDGVFPFEAVYDEPAPLTPSGHAVVCDLVAPQQIINEVWASYVAAMRQQGLGQWIGPNVVGMPEMITSQLGQIVRVPLKALQGRSIRDVIMPLEHASIPTDRMLLFQTARDAMYDIGAYHEITRGQVPPGVDSGVAVRALSEREDGQLSRAKEALQEAMINVARTQLKIAKSRYAPGDERWVPVDRPDLGYQVESVDGAKLPDPERLLITISGFSPRTAEELRADIKEAMQNGWLSPAQGLKALDLGRGVETAFASEQRHYVRARTENLKIERGEVTVQPIMDMETGQPFIDPMTGQPHMQCVYAADQEPLLLMEIDDHVLHMSVLEELITDQTKPREIRELAKMHWDEHNEAMITSTPAPPPESSTGVDNNPAGGSGDPAA